MTSRWGVGLRLVMLTLGSLAACQQGDTHQLTVMVDIDRSRSVCESPHGTDLQGEGLSVRDDQGRVVAEGTLGPGGAAIDYPVPKTRLCRFRAVVDVPDSPSYSVKVDDGDPLRFTRSNLARGRWVAYYPGWYLPVPQAEA